MGRGGSEHARVEGDLVGAGVECRAGPCVPRLGGIQRTPDEGHFIRILVAPKLE